MRAKGEKGMYLYIETCKYRFDSMRNEIQTDISCNHHLINAFSLHTGVNSKTEKEMTKKNENMMSKTARKRRPDRNLLSFYFYYYYALEIQQCHCSNSKGNYLCIIHGCCY